MKQDFLKQSDVIRWCYEGVTDTTLANESREKILKPFAQIEKKWGNDVIGTKNKKQWTTVLCQNLVKEALEKLERVNVMTVTKMKSSLRDKNYDPDLQCDKYVYEVKGRSWCTPGTAGEKVLGVPLKYGEVPRLYHKPLRIVLVGYQEHEARHAWQFGDLLDSNNQTQELKDSLAYHKQHDIEYIGFTDLLKELGYEKGCWNK